MEADIPRKQEWGRAGEAEPTAGSQALAQRWLVRYTGPESQHSAVDAGGALEPTNSRPVWAT